MNHTRTGRFGRLDTLPALGAVLGLVLVSLPAATGAEPGIDAPIATLQTSGGAAGGTGALTPFSSQTGPDTSVIASFTFDDGMGGPDTQGWTEVDETAQTGFFFHVDDFAGLGGVIAPISGSQSMWCGSRGDSCWGFTPGYGNNWGQDFTTLEFPPVTGDVTVTYNIKYSMDGLSDDAAYVQYRDLMGVWQTLKTYTFTSYVLADTVVVPAAEHNGSLYLRFRFVSDGLWSDEDGVFNSDGAVVIDDIVVSDDTGIVDTQDFEAEAPGATKTLDNHWKATVRSGMGEWATLWDGSTVVQETGPVNNTYFWVFFAGSPDYYACGNFPFQKAVPYGPSTEGFYIRNEVRSPWIDITHDEAMQPVASFDNAYLEFDVYRDLPKEVGVFYQWKVRTRSNGGCPGNWSNTSWIYFGTDKAWYRHVGDMTGYIDPGADEIQIALGVYDCGDPLGAECPSGVTGGCHSHAPLLDNVGVIVTSNNQVGVAEGLPDGPTALLAPNPNPARGAVDIAFVLAEPGEAAMDIHDVAGRKVRSLARGMFDAGPRVLSWDGTNDDGMSVAGGIYFIRLRTKTETLVRRVIRLDGR